MLACVGPPRPSLSHIVNLLGLDVSLLGVFGVCGRVRVSVCPERPRASAGTTGPSRVSFMVSLCHVEVGGCERGGQVVQLGLSLGKGAWRQNFLRLRHALKRSSGSRCAGALRAFAAR